MNDQTKNLIENHIDNNEVCLFMKGTPDAPQCGFSMAVSNMLKILEVNFKGINVLEDQSLREGIKVYSDWPTIPQLYIKKEFVGGCDIVKEMYENGELKKIFDNKNIFEIIINNLKKEKLHSKIIIATSNKKIDKKIVNFCKTNNINFFLGCHNNVFLRTKQCIKRYNLNYFVRICADRPFFDVSLMKKMIKLIFQKKVDIVTNAHP